MIYLKTPITMDKIKTLKVGDVVYISGLIFTARDAAHSKMLTHLKNTDEMLLQGEAIYYAGPCPSKPGDAIGSVGPTTSYRMDYYSPKFLSRGLLVSIGKGERSSLVKDAIRQYGGIHFDAIGGAGAYYQSTIKSAKAVYYPELGAEAIYQLEVENFPVIVAIV